MMADASDEYKASVNDPSKELNKHLCTLYQHIFHNWHKYCSKEAFERGEAFT
jgi:hypothetical protein